MSNFVTAAEQDGEWPNDMPFEARTSGPHVAVLLAECLALVAMGVWMLIGA